MRHRLVGIWLVAVAIGCEALPTDGVDTLSVEAPSGGAAAGAANTDPIAEGTAAPEAPATDPVPSGPVVDGAAEAPTESPSSSAEGPTTEPAPTEPAPTDPPPTDPAPTDPAPTDPAPTDPPPTDPAPTDPAPTDPAPTDPAPTDPPPTDPPPTDPAPTDPAPTDPTPTDPTPTEPTPTEPTPTEPAPTDPAPPPVVLVLDVLTPTVHVGAPETDVMAIVTTEDGAAATGVVVGATLEAEGWASGSIAASCTTDTFGICTLSWTLPEEAFTSRTIATVSGRAQDATAEAIVTVFAAPPALVIDGPGIGIALPPVTVAEGATFDVPVMIETGGAMPAAYDMRLDFDPVLLEVVGVRQGDCAAFAAPVSNVDYGANDTGTLYMNAIGSPWPGSCAAEPRVHVAWVTLGVRAGAAGDEATATIPIGCIVRDLYDVNFVRVASDKPCSQADAVGTGDSGAIWVRPAR